jgi:predicted RNA-binding Zn-ribbon protein involved in translation (DUF1610 family)
MHGHPPAVSELCPTCKMGVGAAYSVTINYEYKVVHLRCPDCGREWGVRETFVESPAKGSPGAVGYPR